MPSSLELIVGPASHKRIFAPADVAVGDVIKDAMRGDASAVKVAMTEAGMTLPLDYGNDAEVAEAFTAWTAFRVKRAARSWRLAQAEAAVSITEPVL